MHDHCSSSIPYFINFTFCAFFSLSSLCKTNWLLSSILIIFFLRYTQTHPHTNTNTQTNDHRGCLVLVSCPGQALRVELLSYEDEFDSVGQGSKYSKGAVDFGSKSKETQRRRGVPWTEEEYRYKIFIVFLFWGWFGLDWWCGFWWLIGDLGLISDMGLIGDVGFDGWSVIWVWMVDRWCGFWLVLLDWRCVVVLVMVHLDFDRERKRKRQRQGKRKKEKNRFNGCVK